MRCPNCMADIDYSTVSVDPDAEEDGLEIFFICGGCNGQFFKVLKAEDFEEVDFEEVD